MRVGSFKALRLVAAFFLLLGVSISGGCAGNSSVQASTAISKKISFDIASIHPSKADESMSIAIAGNTFKAQGITLEALISNAFEMREGLLLNLPSWARSDRYDITAKSLNKPLKEFSDADQRQLLISLLEDRFAMRSHSDTKVADIYQLVVDTKGSKLRQASASDLQKSSLSMGSGRLQATAMPIESLIESLSSIVGKTVIDKTGMTGPYNYSLAWSDEMASAAGENSSSSAPSLMAALREQLGLKLTSAKGPQTYLVVDALQKPSAN